MKRKSTTLSISVPDIQKRAADKLPLFLINAALSKIMIGKRTKKGR